MCYGKTLKPGDKALLDFSSDKEAKDFSKAAWDLLGTVVTIKKHWRSSLGEGWTIMEEPMWFSYESFKPIGGSAVVATSCSTYCECVSPDLKTNYADGKSFEFCRRCKKERL